MYFSLNYRTTNGEVEVKCDETVIDSWSEHNDVDFTHYCIVGDKDADNTSYHSGSVLVIDNKAAFNSRPADVVINY